MSALWLIIPVLLPIISGFASRFMVKNEKIRKIFSLAFCLLTSITTLVMLFTVDDATGVFVSFSQVIKFEFKLDGLGKIFAGMLITLWPFALVYSFEYMEGEERRNIYNSYYLMTFGVVLGLSFSGNLLTMYIFYELLTFITLPLIIHSMTKEAKKAGRFYLYFSLSGSSVALVGMIILAVSSNSLEFVYGGVTSEVLAVPYLLCFLGFGVKAAVFPLCFWLPMAGAAPTPTTALLHAVAVVKAGAFAIMRVTYYNFNVSLLAGSWVQAVAICIAAFTIIYGSSMALKEQHFKRRLAYSTISNLSYIVFGTVLMNKIGLEAAVLHLLYHSITKIALFFACGFIIKNTDSHQLYVYQLNGLGKKMPVIFILFAIAAFSVTGIPLFAGFVSKWYLCLAAINEASLFSYIGLASLLISALLTAIYSISIVIRAFAYNPSELSQSKFDVAREPNKIVLGVVGFFCLLIVVFGLYSTPIINLISNLL